MRQLCKCGKRAEKYSSLCLRCEFALEQAQAKGETDDVYFRRKVYRARTEQIKIKNAADQYGIVKIRGK